MPPERNRPTSLWVCQAMIGVASRWIAPSERLIWKEQWWSEIWHRWQFLTHSGLWNGREALLCMVRCASVFPHAFWDYADRRGVRNRIRERIRSPWTCLSAFGVALAALAVLTGGLPATRGIFQTGWSGVDRGLVFVWLHPITGGGDRGVPPDAVTAWAARGKSLEGAAPFTIRHGTLQTGSAKSARVLVVRTQASLFAVLKTKLALGKIPAQQRGMVLTYPLWRTLFGGDRRAVGAKVRFGREWYPVAAVLSPDFRFLSRQPTAYLVQPFLTDGQALVVARVKPGVSEATLDKELTRIAETACYYFFRSQLRYSFMADAAWIPLRVFMLAGLASALLVLLTSRVPLRKLRDLLSPEGRAGVLKRVSFFTAKAGLACLLVFVVVIEWSRSQSAILYGSKDPAAGPFLLWLYILGTMGVLFWSVADQRARCRECLRLMCFPVRVGCPGCILLNWSGTELLCSEGHGLMHVPDRSASWDKESERWISLDESWKDLFADAK